MKMKNKPLKSSNGRYLCDNHNWEGKITHRNTRNEQADILAVPCTEFTPALDETKSYILHTLGHLELLITMKHRFKLFYNRLLQ